MRFFFLLTTLVSFVSAYSQSEVHSLNKGWQFRQAATAKWYKAEVPGTVHTDLFSKGLIPDPFYRDNEKKVQWVEQKVWQYQTSFDVPATIFIKKNIEIVFEGLDTYAEVWLNGKKIIEANNMFREWKMDVKELLKQKSNTLLINFSPAVSIAKEKKQKSVLAYPDNERVFLRKAQYQFGWDWGPRLVTCGIWKDVKIVGWDKRVIKNEKLKIKNDVRLVTQKDSIGEAFYFTVNGKPTFIKGANWIPSDNFLPRVKKLKRYEQLIKAAKDANINMLRVWGGGVYEDEEFYDLCDKYGIMVWQDFMFAGALYPADSAFLKNIEEEVRYQVRRLRHHPSIVLWCGNNEIEEAWFNWGWQKQHNYSPLDSIKLWNDYKKIFHQLIPRILKEEDPDRPYWPSSPSLGWGRDSAYKKGDVHYWGVWWGKEPVEKYNEKVGRFVSEYGMQSMPDMKTIKQFSLPQDWDTSSAVMKTHQKHPFGWENIKYYIEQKFRTPKTFEDLVYVSQLMQADAIKTAIEAHRRNKPVTMGTMFWQWNDCWPVTSWSAVDYYGRKKAMYYEVKRIFKDIVILPFFDSTNTRVKIINELGKMDSLRIVADYILFGKGRLFGAWDWKIETKTEPLWSFLPAKTKTNDTYGVWRFRLMKNTEVIAENFLFSNEPKDLLLFKAKIKWRTIGRDSLELESDKFAYGVFIDVPHGIALEDNFFHLVPNEKKVIKFSSTIPLDLLKKQIKIKSLVDTY